MSRTPTHPVSGADKNPTAAPWLVDSGSVHAAADVVDAAGPLMTQVKLPSKFQIVIEAFGVFP